MADLEHVRENKFNSFILGCHSDPHDHMQESRELLKSDNRSAAKEGTAALYGNAKMLPSSALMGGIIGYLDLLYKIKPAV